MEGNLKTLECEADVWEQIIDNPPIPPRECPWEISADGRSATLKTPIDVEPYSDGDVKRISNLTINISAGTNRYSYVLNSSGQLQTDTNQPVGRNSLFSIQYWLSSGTNYCDTLNNLQSDVADENCGYFVTDSDAKIIGWLPTFNKNYTFRNKGSHPANAIILDTEKDEINIKAGVYDCVATSNPQQFEGCILTKDGSYYIDMETYMMFSIDMTTILNNADLQQYPNVYGIFSNVKYWHNYSSTLYLYDSMNGKASIPLSRNTWVDTSSYIKSLGDSFVSMELSTSSSGSSWNIPNGFSYKCRWYVDKEKVFTTTDRFGFDFLLPSIRDWGDYLVTCLLVNRDGTSSAPTYTAGSSSDCILFLDGVELNNIDYIEFTYLQSVGKKSSYSGLDGGWNAYISKTPTNNTITAIPVVLADEYGYGRMDLRDHSGYDRDRFKKSCNNYSWTAWCNYKWGNDGVILGFTDTKQYPSIKEAVEQGE